MVIPISDGDASVAKYTGIYNLQELTNLLTSFANNFLTSPRCDFPVALGLRSRDHAIATS